MRKIEVPTDSVPEFELGDTAGEGGEGGKRKGGTGPDTEGGGGQEVGGGKKGGNTLARAGTCRKKVQD